MFRPIHFAVLLAGVTLAFSALAQPASDNQGADPPTRVARLAFIRGDVSFVPAGENDWVQAQLNRPLISGDKLWTDRNSRTELEIGSSTIRMDQNTSFDFLNLDDKTAQVELTQGTLNLRVRRLYDNQSYEIDTPTLAFVVSRVGEYRVTVEPDGQATTVSVIHGSGDTYGEGNARFQVEEGQSVTFNDAQLQNYQSNGLPQADDFQTFSQERDTRWDHSRTREYVSEDVIGYQDLDDNGDWNDVPEYGHVWYPSHVAVGWSPYHNGHWGWVGAYGWSWIDDEPWGFAPSHYGRWAYIDNRWGWSPGPIDARPYYAPALVAFIGGGVGVSIGFDSGPVGWFPLGYNDVYYPSYRVSQGYFSGINISNTHVSNTVINNYYGNYSSGNVNYGQINYANRNVAGAITAVPAAAFVSARPVAGAAIAVNKQTFANSRVSGFAAVAPTRASLTSATAARSLPPAALANRQIVAATKPPAPVAPFAQRQGLLQKNPGQPLRENQLRAPVAATAAAKGVAAAPGTVAARPNVRVVTNSGVPARTAAPVLPARAGGAPNAANARVAPVGAPGAATRATPAIPATPATPGGRATPATPATPAMPPNRANMPPRGNAADARTLPPATGRPAPNARLDSSRFAHPNAAPQNNSGDASRAVTGRPSQQPSAQRNTSPNAVNQRGSASRSEPGSRPPPVSRPAPTPNSDLRSNSNAVTPANRNPPEHRMPPANNNPRATAPQQEYRTPQANPRNNPAAQDYQRPAPVREAPHAAPQQQYQQHQAPQVQQQQRAAPAPQVQQQRAAPQPQMQQRAAPPPQMQQRAAPQPQMQQQQMQQRAAPPQQIQQRAAPPPPQMRAPAPARTPPPPKDKDDDKNHGG